MLLPAVILLVSAAAVAGLTALVRRYALARSIIDVPNVRSSHSIPTPRGGGVAIAGVLLPGLLLLELAGWISAREAAALVGGGALVAAVGWLEDERGVAAPTRALLHVIAACWAVYWLGGLRELNVGPRSMSLGPVGALIAVLGIVWATNLYNFMDGIDGIAGAQAVAAGLVGGVLLLSTGRVGLAMIALVAAATSIGFLVWNWSPAKIFMGDVGSGLLGFLFGTLALASENAGGVPLLAWAVILGVFVFDATITLGRRIVRRERWYEAHRSHAYQRLVRSGWTHAQVSIAAFVTAGVLGAFAFVGSRWHTLLVPSLIGATLLLVALYLLVERIAPMDRTERRDGA
jgi:Fuc2NAc and GlcNAc transferase